MKLQYAFYYTIIICTYNPHSTIPLSSALTTYILLYHYHLHLQPTFYYTIIICTYNLHSTIPLSSALTTYILLYHYYLHMQPAIYTTINTHLYTQLEYTIIRHNEHLPITPNPSVPDCPTVPLFGQISIHGRDNPSSFPACSTPVCSPYGDSAFWIY